MTGVLIRARCRCNSALAVWEISCVRLRPPPLAFTDSTQAVSLSQRRSQLSRFRAGSRWTHSDLAPHPLLGPSSDRSGLSRNPQPSTPARLKLGNNLSTSSSETISSHFCTVNQHRPTLQHSSPTTIQPSASRLPPSRSSPLSLTRPTSRSQSPTSSGQSQDTARATRQRLESSSRSYENAQLQVRG